MGNIRREVIEYSVFAIMAQAVVAAMLAVLNEVPDTGRLLIIIMLIGVMARLLVASPRSEHDEGFWRVAMVLVLGYVVYQTMYSTDHASQTYFWVAAAFVWGSALADACNRRFWVMQGKVPMPLFLILVVPQLGLTAATAHVVGLI
jgi:hypothetical protein